jgi:hypothetical protein
MITTLASLIKPGDRICGHVVMAVQHYRSVAGYYVSVTFDDGTSQGWHSEDLVEVAR